MNQIPLCRCSYGPYARAMIRVCKEESFHQRQGYEIMLTLCRGSAEQKAMAQDALNRWWWPCLMMFGPPDTASQHSDQSTRWKNQALLQRRAAPEIRGRHGCPRPTTSAWTIPDPGAAPAMRTAGTTCSARSTGRNSASVLAGNGPCNRERLEARHGRPTRKGAWVREAALAYAAKQSARIAA